MLKSISEYIAKLDKITWKLSKDGLVSKDGKWELTYSIKEANSYHDKEMPLQIVINTRYNGNSVSTWGCVSNEENSEFIFWIQKLRAALRVLEDNEERDFRADGKVLWESI